MHEFLSSVRKSLAQTNDAHPLSDEEVEALILNFLQTRGERGASEEEVLKIVRWAEMVRIGESMLNLVLSGYVDIDWSEEKNDILVQANERGKKAMQDYKG